MVAPRFPLHVVYHSQPSQNPAAGRIARSRDLVPWADPYIALLIRRLQDEVRAERAEQLSTSRGDAENGELQLEATPPGLEEPLDFDFPDSPSWSLEDLPPSQPR